MYAVLARTKLKFGPPGKVVSAEGVTTNEPFKQQPVALNFSPQQYRSRGDDVGSLLCTNWKSNNNLTGNHDDILYILYIIYQP